MDNLFTFFLSVIASVVANYICDFLNRNNSDRQ